MDLVSGLEPWETEDWVPSGDDLPAWLAELRERHRAALDEFAKSIAGVTDTEADVEASARAWRREVQAAVAEGREPPKREAGEVIGEARVAVAREDAGYARRVLAEVGVEVLTAIRERRDEFINDFYFRSSVALRHAIGRGPNGLTEADRQRIARATAGESEDSMPDVSDPANDALTNLGAQEASNAAAA
jgi:hypothetical protein